MSNEMLTMLKDALDMFAFLAVELIILFFGDQLHCWDSARVSYARKDSIDSELA